MPQLPKRNPARANKSSTRATLRLEHDVEVPELPDRGVPWHPQTMLWWADIWASPMAPEYHESDVHGLYALAALVDDFWTADSPRSRSQLAAEIRLQRQNFGLTPLDRRRLQWEIERTDEAQTKGRRRRETEAPKTGEAKPDPRLSLVS